MQTPSALVLGSLVGDALALGPHWIYDQQAIAQALGSVEHYAAPLSSYHPGKQAGDLTHYGDQCVVLLQSLQRCGGFDVAQFAQDWRFFWEKSGTSSYRDAATRQTLEHMQQGLPLDQVASASHDIAGAARIAPLFVLDGLSTEQRVAVARAQTALTHGDEAVIEAAEFFTRLVIALQAGNEMSRAFAELAARPWQSIPASWFHAAQESSADTTSTDLEALDAHGLSCHVADAFPGICHLLLRYPTSPAMGLRLNAAAGGDSAARGLLLGLVYVASVGLGTFPAEWVAQLRRCEWVDGLRHQVACSD